MFFTQTGLNVIEVTTYKKKLYAHIFNHFTCWNFIICSCSFITAAVLCDKMSSIENPISPRFAFLLLGASSPSGLGDRVFLLF